MKTPNAFLGGLKTGLAALTLAATCNPPSKIDEIDAKIGEINARYEGIDHDSSLTDQREEVRIQLQKIGFILLGSGDIAQHRAGVNFVVTAYPQTAPDPAAQAQYDHAAYEEALRAQECQYVVFPHGMITPFRRNLRPQQCFNPNGNYVSYETTSDYNAALKLLTTASPEMKDRIVSDVKDRETDKPVFVELLQAAAQKDASDSSSTKYSKIEKLCDILGESLKPEMLSDGVSKESLCYGDYYAEMLKKRWYSGVREMGKKLGKDEEQVSTDFLKVLPTDTNADSVEWLSIFAFIESTEDPEALLKALERLGNKEVISTRAHELGSISKNYRHKNLSANIACILGETSWSRDLGDCSKAALEAKRDEESCDVAGIADELRAIRLIDGVSDPFEFLLDRYHAELITAASNGTASEKLNNLGSAAKTLQNFLKMADRQLNPACERVSTRANENN